MGVIRTSLDVVTCGWLWICVITFPVFAHAGGLGFQISAFGLGLSGLAVCLANPRHFSAIKPIWIALYAASILWVWLTVLWSPYTGGLFQGNAFIFLIFASVLLFIPVIFARLSDDMRFYMRHAVLATAVFGAAVMLLDMLSGYGLALWVDPVADGSNMNIRQANAEMNLGRGLLTYTQLAWVIVIGLSLSIRRGWILALGFIAALLATAYLNRLSLTLPTILVSGFLAALAWKRPTLGITLALFIAGASLLFAPLIGWTSGWVPEDSLGQIPISWEHRLRMWDYVFDEIWDAPLLGHGFDASRSYSDTFAARNGQDIVIVSMHPHNVGLQLWLETGVISVLLFCGVLAASLRPLLRIFGSPARAACLTSLIIATTIHGATTIGAWQYWWWGVTLLSACFIRLMPQKSDIPLR